MLQADKSAFKAKKIGGPLAGVKQPLKNGPRVGLGQVQVDTLDFNKKILHASWHPREYTIAVCHFTFDTKPSNFTDVTHSQIAATNNLFLYSAA